MLTPLFKTLYTDKSSGEVVTKTLDDLPEEDRRRIKQYKIEEGKVPAYLKMCAGVEGEYSYRRRDKNGQ